jgi:hypothetical protein
MVAAIFPGQVQTIIGNNIDSGEISREISNLKEKDALQNTDTSYDPSVLDEVTKTNGYFTENRGQVDEKAVKYYVEGGGVWFLDDSVVFGIQESQDTDRMGQRKGVALKLVFEGANQIEPEGRDLLPQWSNFYYGNDPSGWRTKVPHYGEITYANIYNDIDLVYRITDLGLKYDFIVHPGGNPDDIRMKYEGIDALRIDSSGDLEIHAGKNLVTDSSLFIYQLDNEGTNEIEGEFKMLDSATYGFELSGDYNKGKDLIIDPLLWSTFVNGHTEMLEGGEDVAVGTPIPIDIVRALPSPEPKLPVFVTGFTCSPNFPRVDGPYEYEGNCDVFVVVLDESSNPMRIIFSTFIGGPDYEIGTAILVDNDNVAYVTGHTNSSDFPTTSNAFDREFNGTSDAFVLSLDMTGATLIFSTLFGGSSIEESHDIIFFQDDLAMTGTTMSDDFPRICPNLTYDHDYNGGLDVFLILFDIAGTSLVYSTYVGAKQDEIGYSLDWYDVFIYVTGKTNSTHFPTTSGVYDESYNGGYDAFVFKIDVGGSGQLYKGTFVGGSKNEIGYEIRVKGFDLYVAGETYSLDFPNTTNAFDRTHNGGSDVFVFQMSVFLNGLDFSTYVGGDDDDSGRAMDNYFDEIFVTGYTRSDNFPTIGWGEDWSHNGEKDAFLFRLNFNNIPLFQLQYSSYVGGENNSEGKGIFASGMHAYVTGLTYSFDFPTTSSAYDALYDGGGDVFVFTSNCPFGNLINITIVIAHPTVFDVEDPTGGMELFLELPEGYDINDINVSTIVISVINGYPVNIPVNKYPISYGDYDGDGIPDLMVTVHNKALIPLLIALVKLPSYVKLTFTGALYNNTQFVGSETILVYKKSPRELKQEAAAMLTSNKTGDKKIDKTLDKAIDHIENSLEDALWLDDLHLDPKHGNKVFDEEKKATLELQNLIKEKKVPDAVRDLCRDAIDNLVEADALLVHVTYLEANEYAGDEKVDKELDKCVEKFEMIEKELLKEQHHKVIDHLKKVWRHAQNAIKHGK